MSSSRSSGFPRLALDDENLWVAWIEVGEPSRLRIGRLSLHEMDEVDSPS